MILLIDSLEFILNAFDSIGYQYGFCKLDLWFNYNFDDSSLMGQKRNQRYFYDLIQE